MAITNLKDMLIPWERRLASGLILKGWRSRPTGKPVIHFTHGNGLCCLAYEPFLAQLVQSYDLFLYDIQGHGDSDTGEQFMGWEQSAEALHDVWLTYKGKYGNVSSIGIGHSLGGVITLLRASRYPNEFSRICLLDPVLLSASMIWGARIDRFFRRTQNMPLAKQARRRRSHWANETTAYQFFCLQPFFKSWSSQSLHAYIKHGLALHNKELRLKCSPDLEASIFESVPTKLWPAIRKLSTHTNIIYGSKTYPFIQDSISKALLQNHQITAEQVEGDHCFVQANPISMAEKIKHIIRKESYAVASSI